jgi:hypothetical protein
MYWSYYLFLGDFHPKIQQYPRCAVIKHIKHDKTVKSGNLEVSEQKWRFTDVESLGKKFDTPPRFRGNTG